MKRAANVAMLGLRFDSLDDFETFFLECGLIDTYIIGEALEKFGNEPPLGEVFALSLASLYSPVLLLLPVVCIGGMTRYERYTLSLMRTSESRSRLSVCPEHILFHMKGSLHDECQKELP